MIQVATEIGIAVCIASSLGTFFGVMSSLIVFNAMHERKERKRRNQ